MTLVDRRGLDISGATAVARDAFERALESHLSWRSGAEVHLEQALLEAPAFTMAYVFRAYFSLASRDRARVSRARAAYAIASSLPATPRERLHVTAIKAALDDDFEALRTVLQRLLDQYPRDILALQIGHAFDYLTGEIEGMSARITAVLPAWPSDAPGYHAVLAMQAFSLVENAQYGAAADRARHALEIDPWDARAHHAVTHIYEMTGNPTAGLRWMREREKFWAANAVAATHCWWHCALFHLTLGRAASALAVFDQRVRGKPSADIADMIDASALLWRIDLAGGDAGSRWVELASAWAGHIEDGYCTFSDLHAMLAHVGAGDWRGAGRLEKQLLKSYMRQTRYGETTRLVGLPACRAIMAFGRGDYARAVRLLAALPPHARRIGGSHAQRDLLYLTLLEAARRLRRSAPLDALASHRVQRKLPASRSHEEVTHP
jgi:hypothetical protein